MAAPSPAAATTPTGASAPAPALAPALAPAPVANVGASGSAGALTPSSASANGAKPATSENAEGMDAHTTQALALSLLLTASVPLLPPGWQIARDPATGKFYFYNTSTGVVQWEPPGISASAGVDAAAADAAQQAAASSAASALMAGKRSHDGAPALSAAGVLLAGAGGVGGSHHSEKRARLGEGRQSDFEEEVVAKLTTWCGEPTTWNTKKKVIEMFKTSPMWASWVKAGHNEQKLVNFINRLKIKHLEDGHNKDNGAGVSEFEPEVKELLIQICGEPPTSWNTKKKVIDAFKESVLWPKWTTAQHSEQKLVNLINRLRIRYTEEAAKGTAAAAAALAAANGTAPPGGVITGVVGAVGGVSAFESEVVGQLQQICGEPTTWNTKKKVIDQFKASVMWDSWITAGHNEQKLVNFINRLKIKHLEEGGGTHTGGGGVSSFEPQVVKELANYCGPNAANWNTKKNVMDALKNSPMWTNWSTTGHTEQQLVNFINRLKMKHLKDEPIVPPPIPVPAAPSASTAPSAAAGLAAAAALYSAVQAQANAAAQAAAVTGAATKKDGEETEEDPEGKGKKEDAMAMDLSKAPEADKMVLHVEPKDDAAAQKAKEAATLEEKIVAALVAPPEGIGVNSFTQGVPTPPKEGEPPREEPPKV